LNTVIYRLARWLKQANYWLTAQVALLALRLLRQLSADRALDFADRAARRIGPWFGRHHVALDNLRKAYPEKTEDDIQAVASDMWGNMARLGAEYIFLDTLFDYDDQKPDAPSRIEVAGLHHFKRIAQEGRPNILFTAHLGNFELLPIAGAAYGMKVTALFRPPNNPYIADYILSTRRSAMGDLLPSHKGSAFALARILEANGTIGILVDQKFRYGIRTQFFGRECETSPLLPKLARQYDCDVYPARCVRLPGNRFRLEIEEKIELPRDGDGKVEVIAAAQLLNDVVERWVREDPGQWMWFHKRWGLMKRERRRRRKTASSSRR
jgi:KDO2-lipid IV(A) lauroyltransferase